MAIQTGIANVDAAFVELQAIVSALAEGNALKAGSLALEQVRVRELQAKVDEQAKEIAALLLKANAPQ